MQPEYQKDVDHQPENQPLAEKPEAGKHPEQLSNVNQTVTGNSMPSNKPSRKKLFIWSAIAAVIVVLASSVTAFAFWYSNPDKVISDAVSHALTAKTSISEGSFVFKDSESKAEVNLNFSSKANAAKLSGQLQLDAKIKGDGFDVEFKGAGMATESGTVFFRLENARKLLDQALDTESVSEYVSDQLKTDLENFVTKIDNKWIKLEQSDISDFSSKYEEQRSCAQKVLNDFYSNKKQQQQIYTIYDKNRFLKVTPSDQSRAIDGTDSIAYNLGWDVRKVDSFGKAMEDAEVVKALEACYDEDDKSYSQGDAYQKTDEEYTDSQKEVDAYKTTIWVSRWGHEFKQVRVTRDEDGQSMVFEAKFKSNQPVVLQDPADALSAKDLIEEFKGIIDDAQEEQEANDDGLTLNEDSSERDI